MSGNSNFNDSQRTISAPLVQQPGLPEAALTDSSTPQPIIVEPPVAVVQTTAAGPITTATTEGTIRRRNYSRNPRRSMRLALRNRRRSQRLIEMALNSANDA